MEILMFDWAWECPLQAETVSSMRDFLPLISAITALIAVFFGPLVQLIIMKRQQRASVVSNNRVRWIEDFRKEIAEFIAACHLHEVEKYYFKEAEEAKDASKTEQYRKSKDISFLRVNTLLHTIRLKLEPNDSNKIKDKDIWGQITDLDNLDVHEFEALENFETAFLEKVEPLRQAVRIKLSNEWRRVEKLE